VEPHRRQLLAASMAWAPGTNGPVSGEVVVITARTPSEFAALHAGKLAGRWVMLAPSLPMHNRDGPPLSARDSAALVEARHAYYALPTDPDALALRRRLTALVASEGALGLVGEGEKPYGLLRAAGSPDRFFPLPYLVVAHDTYGQLHRLVTAGHRVVLRADVHNTLTREPVSAQNTIAELRGSTRPDEVVVLGAHLDSWDLGTGASDNAAGAVAVLEALRILKASGVRPQRTIRFALFSGEEQGLLGSQAHVQARLGEMARTQAVLVLDNGTGRITGMSLQGWEAMRPLWEALFSPIADLGPFTVLSRNKGGSDHRPFIAHGVPGFNFDQEPRGYDFTWHSQVDTYDHAVPEDVRQAATVMAATAYELANLPSLLPRAPRP
jgi:carboxypeptidase Q